MRYKPAHKQTIKIGNEQNSLVLNLNWTKLYHIEQNQYRTEQSSTKLTELNAIDQNQDDQNGIYIMISTERNRMTLTKAHWTDQLLLAFEQRWTELAQPYRTEQTRTELNDVQQKCTELKATDYIRQELKGKEHKELIPTEPADLNQSYQKRTDLIAIEKTERSKQNITEVNRTVINWSKLNRTELFERKWS